MPFYVSFEDFSKIYKKFFLTQPVVIQYIGRLAGLELPRVRSHASSGGDTARLATLYLASLDQETVAALASLYRADLQLFRYSEHQFITEGKNLNISS